MAPVPPPPAESLRRSLLAWYDQHARALPWRATAGTAADPYRVWLSEVMLQQTTVAHALAYFNRFTERWPTVAALSRAPDPEVMAAWAGLGYYARARNLIACARVVTEEFGGLFPARESELRRLPGVGAYTAAAIAAIAFGETANVVDGNVERVIARLNAVAAPLPVAKDRLRALAGDLVRDDRPGDWAQALMDLGATICRPAAPLCGVCPVAEFCRGRAAGRPESYPRKSKKPARPERFGVAYLIRRGGDIAVLRRAADGLLGGMLGLPGGPWVAEASVLAGGRGNAPIAAAWIDRGVARHVFTHFALNLGVLETRIDSHRVEFAAQWLPIDIAAAAMPSLYKKALRRAGGGGVA